MLSETEKLILIYRSKARDCAALAESARPENRATYRQLAQTWERIATQIEDLRTLDVTLAKSPIAGVPPPNR